MKYPPGTKVVLNKVWGNWNLVATVKGYAEGTHAVVVAGHNAQDCTNIVRVGTKTKQSFHNSFISRATCRTEVKDGFARIR